MKFNNIYRLKIDKNEINYLLTNLKRMKNI